MAHPEWPFMGANQQWDTDQRSRFPVYAAATANGVSLTDMWYGGCPTAPSRTVSTAAMVDEWQLALPGVKTFRQLFNQFQFTGPGGGYFDTRSQQFISRLTSYGAKHLWVLMDGPSQRSYDHEPGTSTAEGTVPGTQYWTHYPDGAAIDADPAGTVPMVMSTIHASQTLAWSRLLAYLQANPNVYANTIGFELINEPDTYNSAGQIPGVGQVTAMTYYVQHCLALVDMIDAVFPGHDIYVGGWRYSADCNVFYNTYLPAYGCTAYQALVDRIGEDRLVWSIHLYPDWVDGAVVTTMEQVDAGIANRFGDALSRGHRVAITEINAQNDHFNNVSYSSQIIRKSALLIRNTRLFRDNRISIFWWPFSAWAAASVFDARGDGIKHNFQNSMQGALNVWAHNNASDWFVGPDSGPRTAEFVPCSRGVTNAVSDPDYQIKRPGGVGESIDAVTGYARGFGGRGVAVVNPVETANNLLIGGNGRNILYGSALYDDFLSLGRGGGVVRCYGGYNSVNTNGGNNLIYGGSLWTLVTSYWGQTTVVVDPAATTIIMGWSPLRGDRLSFKGLVTAAQVKAGSATNAPPGNIAGEVDIVITFPQGGTLRMIGLAYIKDVIDTYVMDFTDGWYGPSWVEPPDYDPADFGLPITPPSPPEYPPEVARWRDGSPALYFASDWAAFVPRGNWSPNA